MSGQTPIYRHELKYVISSAQLAVLKSRVERLMELDSHAGPDGVYRIRSLYFDDYHNRCFYENENGTDPREKFRIRVYNQSLDQIRLECKRKERGKTHKTSCQLTREQAELIVRGQPLDNLPSLPPLLRKMVLQMRTMRLRPVVIVEYDRIPYVYPYGNVRVTFDMHMVSAPDTKNFLTGTTLRRPLMPAGQYLMEVKYDEFLPDVIYRSLNLNQLQQTAYSKYYLSRKYTLHK